MWNEFVYGLRHYADFKGRSNRRELWLSTLMTFLVLGAVLIVDSQAGLSGLLFVPALLGSIVPSWAVQVRRIQDTGKPGWLIVLAFVPLASLLMLYFFLKKGDEGPNKWGPAPPPRRTPAARPDFAPAERTF